MKLFPSRKAARITITRAAAKLLDRCWRARSTSSRQLSPDQLVDRRYHKFRSMGRFFA